MHIAWANDLHLWPTSPWSHIQGFPQSASEHCFPTCSHSLLFIPSTPLSKPLSCFQHSILLYLVIVCLHCFLPCLLESLILHVPPHPRLDIQRPCGNKHKALGVSTSNLVVLVVVV